MVAWSLVGLVMLAVAAAVAALVLWGLLYLLVGLFHALKAERLPGENDARWERDQGREAGRSEGERHSPDR